MLRITTALLAFSLALTAPAASAQGLMEPAEALAWRSFQACLAVSRGAPLAKAAAEAGYRLDGDVWAASAGDRDFVIEVQSMAQPAGAKLCLTTSRGPLADHDGLGKRLAAWAAREGFVAAPDSVSAAGGRFVQYATQDESRATGLAFYPEGNPAQPARSVLFLGWKAP